MEIQQLKEELKEIKANGYVVSKRKGNTGIGYTLETLLKIKENNLKTPDFGKIEIKSQRRNVSNKVTMFTFNRAAWKIKQKDLIEKYGYIDTNKRLSLYCTANSKPNNQGLYLKIEDETLRLSHVNKELIAEWKVIDLVETFKSKMPALVVVYADSRINSDEKEELWFNESYLLENPDKDNFIDLIKKAIIIVDIRMHLKKKGIVRNHGTAFRIDERFLNLCFGTKKLLL
ncbi:MAG: MvaI/BcnI family restriction endonuclease [bacterium]